MWILLCINSENTERLLLLCVLHTIIHIGVSTYRFVIDFKLN